MITLDYLAGLFDGEGGVLINRYKAKLGIRYTITLQITNTHKIIFVMFYQK